MTTNASEAQRSLREAWDELLASLAEARDALDQPALMPPPPSERGLAEGYRYLMGHLHAAVERAFHADPLRPHFRNALSIVTRATIDNADAIYFYAPLDGRREYLIRGEPGERPRRRPQGAPTQPTATPTTSAVGSSSTTGSVRTRSTSRPRRRMSWANLLQSTCRRISRTRRSVRTGERGRRRLNALWHGRSSCTCAAATSLRRLRAFLAASRTCCAGGPWSGGPPLRSEQGEDDDLRKFVLSGLIPVVNREGFQHTSRARNERRGRTCP